MEVRDLNLWIFRPPIALENSERFESVFRFWDKIWKDVYAEIGRNELLSSDQLTRQHEVLVLFYGARPVATVCHRYADLSAESTLRDSYFRVSWTETEIAQLKKTGGQVLIGSQIMVDPEFRKSASGIAVKHLISFISLAHAQSVYVDVVLGAMRKDKGMDRVFYEAGAETLKSGVPYFGAEVDLVAFYPKRKPIVIPKEFAEAVDQFLDSATYAKSLEIPVSIKKGRAA